MSEFETYRQPDSYYHDQYDRNTIAVMKVIEKEMEAAEKLFYIDADNLSSLQNNTTYIGHRIKYLDTGVAFARNKRFAIEEQMRADESKDRMIKSQIIPSNINCLTCGEPMQFELYDFIDKGAKLLMWFSCSDGHVPRRAFFGDGREFHAPEIRCQDCGGNLRSSKKKTKKKIILTDICQVCKKKSVLEFERSTEKILPIDEQERKRYCTDFIGRRNFDDDLKAIADLSDILEEQDAKDKYEFKNINRLNIAQLEETLTAAVDGSGFVKLQFEKPKISRYLTVEFSVQDTQDRDSAKSIKAIKKIVDNTLFPTNWRLMSPGFEYRLGFLSAQLKGFSLDEDLLKIAQEIWKKKKG